MAPKPFVRTLPVLLFLAVWLLGACSAMKNSSQLPLDPAAIPTYAVQTLIAHQTQAAQGIVASLTPTRTPYPTSTLAPSSTPLNTSTPIPTTTPIPSLTPVPTSTPNIAATVQAIATRGGSWGGGSGSGSGGGSGSTGTSGSGGASSSGSGTMTKLCNSAALVKDLTVPEGSILSPSAYFTKVWRIRNNGTCTWTTKYLFGLASGDQMEGKTVAVPETVPPGGTVDIAVDMIAPSAPGSYKGAWMFRSPDGRFGTGASAKFGFPVQIEVQENDRNTIFDMVLNACAAQWVSSAGDLTCPGSDQDKHGFVLQVDKPNLESRKEDEPALWTSPDMVKDGWISGVFPTIKLRYGDHFMADIGCLAGYPKCDVTFKLEYIIGNQDPKKLGEWHEDTDGNTTRIDVDLSALGGKEVKLILHVATRGAFTDDAPFWLVPQVDHLK